MWKDEQGNTWYRGNLHAHTQRSDGRLSYEDMVSLYRDAGYDFVAATDHWVWSETEESQDFLLLAGCEYDVGLKVQEGVYHIVGIECEKAPDLVRRAPGLTAQKIIDAIHEEGGFAILAHPSWSLNRVDRVLKLRDIDAAEIYNTFSGVPWNGRPYSGDFVDMMAAEGRYLPCMAADDSHRYEGEAGRSYLMVKAEALTRDGIMTALRRGDFLATQGPMMSVRLEEDRAVVDCTEAAQVVFYSDAVYSWERVTRGKGITHASCRFMPNDTYIRVEVTDEQGRTAWSTPVPIRRG